MSSELIRANHAALTITFTADAVAQKESALESCALIGRVTNASEQTVAVEAQRALAVIIKAVEKGRQEAKKPALEYGRNIDAECKAFVEELRAEELRVAGLIGEFQETERAKVRAAEAARQLEMQRIEAERQAELNRIAAEEKARIDAEIARERDREAKIAEAKNLDEVTAIREEAAEAARKAQEAQQHAANMAALIEEQAAAKAAVLPVVAPVKADGQRVRVDWDITVSDVHALYRHHPNCVELKPRLSEIRQLLDAGVTPKGVIAKKVAKSGVSTRTREAINV